jgi:hypothetical protein
MSKTIIGGLEQWCLRKHLEFALKLSVVLLGILGYFYFGTLANKMDHLQTVLENFSVRWSFHYYYIQQLQWLFVCLLFGSLQYGELTFNLLRELGP